MDRLGGGRLAAVIGVLVLLDPAPSLGQVEPPSPRTAAVRDRRRPGGVLGFRRGGERARDRNGNARAPECSFGTEGFAEGICRAKL